MVKICGACNGSGHYDDNGSPKCGACHGLGVERGKMPYRLWKHIVIKYFDVEVSKVEKIFERWKD
jgi:hypothetical protein